MLLREIVSRGVSIDFFTKPRFVDPRPAVSDLDCKGMLQLVDCTNHIGDSLRRWLTPSGHGLWGRFWQALDATSYNRGIVRRMRQHSVGDIDLWLGDWAKGRGERPVISFAQGPPGTDARSVLDRTGLIERLAVQPFDYSFPPLRIID